MYFLAQHAIVFSNLHTTVEGFWLKRANFLDSLPEIATLVGVTIFLIERAEVLNLAALLSFLTNLLSR